MLMSLCISQGLVLSYKNVEGFVYVCVCVLDWGGGGEGGVDGFILYFPSFFFFFTTTSYM